MVFISLQPFNVRKTFLLVFALLCLSSISVFAESLFIGVDSTPYDRQMTRIRPVLSTKQNARKEDLSLALVNHWIQDLRGIPYGFSPQWKTPSEVQTAPVADCKGKSVALYQRMNSHGAQNVRLVIGKRTRHSRKTHAWLEWQTETGRYLLDPTINWAAYRADEVNRGTYLPLYAYAGTRKYRAGTATLLAKN
jgi:hypothetical protein